MPYVKISVPYLHTFVPPEAPAIAAQLRAIAGPVRALAQELRAIDGTLDASWEGNSKNRFSEAYRPTINRVEDLAASIEHAAGRIGSMTVSIWETRTERVWEPEPAEAQGT
jgi:uncharacterized protein YukE